MSWLTNWFRSWRKKPDAPVENPAPIEAKDMESAVWISLSRVQDILKPAMDIVSRLDISLKPELKANTSASMNATAVVAAVLDTAGKADGKLIEDAATLAKKIYALSAGEAVGKVAVFLLGRVAPGLSEDELKLAITLAYRAYQLMQKARG